MKYLVHFKPGKKLASLIAQFDDLKIPSSGLHASLCVIDMDPKKETEYIRQLAQSKFHPFEVETTKLELFDKDSLVLKLTKPNELARIHQEVVYLSRWYAAKKSVFQDSKDKYYLKNYNPHITISKSGSLKDTNSHFFKPMVGLDFLVSDFYLSKKDNDWVELAKFPAIEYKVDLLDLKNKLFKHFSSDKQR